VAVASAQPRSKKIDNYELASFETYLLERSTTWYSGVTVTVNPPGNVIVYKFQTTPPLTNTIHKVENQTLSVNSKSYEFYAYHLTPGSKLTVTYNLAFPLNFYVVKSTKDWNKWVDGYDTQQFLYYGTSYTYTIQSTTEEDFYFAWESPTYGSVVTGNANFAIDLADYDYSNPQDSCNFTTLFAQSDCDMDLDRGSSQVVLVRAMEQDVMNGVTPFNYRWHARTTFYWQIFGIVIGCVAGIGLAILICCCVRRRRKMANESPVLASDNSAAPNTPILASSSDPVSPPLPSASAPPPDYAKYDYETPSAPPMAAPTDPAAPPAYNPYL